MKLLPLTIELYIYSQLSPVNLAYITSFNNWNIYVHVLPALTI